MKFVLFIGELPPHGAKLKEDLEAQGFTCSAASNPDEIDQLGRQLGKVTLLFTDHKLAYKMLSENKWNSFPSLHIFYASKKLHVPPDAQAKLDRVSLLFFYPEVQRSLVQKLNQFQLQAKTEDIELEFNVHQTGRK